MGRWLARIVVLLAAPALLGGCLEMAPRSSVAFQPPAEREVRYAAEVALAIKEDRRHEVSEAAANGRLVLPQMPEVWAGAPGAGPIGAEGAREPVARDAVGSAAAGMASAPPTAACEGPARRGADRDTACRRPWPGAGPTLPALFPAAVAPALGPHR
ncbi:MAG TPA: hypothetical protein VFY19_09245 [Geminicoccaceae bacterium]|nr:hypothetical protein [Geminicoccaceae bacterium]